MNSEEKAGRIGREAARWLTQAQADLKTAEVLLDSERFYMVCFLSQQIAEKAM
jgi:HEPN domain-containing protein